MMTLEQKPSADWRLKISRLLWSLTVKEQTFTNRLQKNIANKLINDIDKQIFLWYSNIRV